MVFFFNKKTSQKFICGIRQASYWLGCLSEKPKAKNPKAKKIYPTIVIQIELNLYPAKNSIDPIQTNAKHIKINKGLLVIFFIPSLLIFIVKLFNLLL